MPQPEPIFLYSKINSLKLSKINAPNSPAAFMNNTQSIDPVGEWTHCSGITNETRFFSHCFYVFVEHTNANKCTFLAYIPDTENSLYIKSNVSFTSAFHSRMDFSSWNFFLSVWQCIMFQLRFMGMSPNRH